MSERRCCCNCSRNKRTGTVDFIKCNCEIDGHAIGYLENFEGWCKRWKNGAVVAWHVNDEVEGSMIVFAVTRGQARSIAFGMDEFEGAEWTELRVIRAPEFDKYWSAGKAYMDWYDAEDRIALVKAGWSCMEPIPEDCTRCPAAEWCGAKMNEVENMV